LGIPGDTRISARFGQKNGHPHPLAGIRHWIMDISNDFHDAHIDFVEGTTTSQYIGFDSKIKQG
jgi:hypothetical protein